MSDWAWDGPTDVLMKAAKQAIQAMTEVTPVSRARLPITAGLYASWDVVDTQQTLQVEALLGEALDLLDRGLRVRAEWSILAEKRTRQEIDFLEFYDLDAIAVAEEKSGKFLVPALECGHSYAAESFTFCGTQEAAKQFTWIATIALSDVEIGRQVSAMRVASMLGELPMFEGDKFYPFAPHNSKPDPNNTKDEASYSLGYPKAVKDSVKNHASTSAETRGTHSLNIDAANAKAQLASSSFGSKAQEQRALAAQFVSDWESANVSFKEQRADVSRTNMARRRLAFLEPGGALNFQEQMDRLKTRFVRDFSDAMQRMGVIAECMDELFAYTTVPLPAPDKNPSLFDDAIDWVRDAQEFLTVFRRTDQETTVVVSIATLVGADKFAEGLKEGLWTLDLTDALGKFPGIQVRLRGIGGAVRYAADADERDASGSWAVTLDIPTKATYRRSAKVSTDMGRLATVQAALPRVRLGRVVHQGSRRGTELGGVVSAFNASPIGEWTVSVDDTSSGGIPRKALKDVLVELHLAYQAAK